MTRKEENDLRMAIFKANIEVAELRLRSTGRTTRLIDDTIQRLFDHPNEWIVVSDHWPTKQAQVLFVHRIKRRLLSEHGIKLETRHDISLWDNQIKIKLKNYKVPNFDREINEIMERQEVWKRMLVDGITDKFA